MLTEKNKISIRQAFILFTVASLSPAIRFFPSRCAKMGEAAGWIAPLLGAVPLLLVCIVLHALFKNEKINSLSDAFYAALGKTAGKILLSLYFILTLILYCLYIRYYAERLLSSIFPNTDIRFFIVTMMLVVYIATRGKLEAFARFSELAFIVFIFTFFIFFIFMIPNVKADNLFPLTHYDIIPAIKATYPILGIWGYITLLFFVGDQIKSKNQIKKQSKRSILFLSVMTLLMMFFVIGSLGYTVAQRMPLPFFSATKMISFMETLDRLEPILLTAWVISDFIIITMFAFIIMHIIKSLFAVSETKFFSSPLILLGYFGSQYLTSSRFETELFSSSVILHINVIACFIIPVVILAIGKLRKKI